MQLTILRNCFLLLIFFIPPAKVFSQHCIVHLLTNNKPASLQLIAYLKKGEITVFEKELSQSLLASKPVSIDFIFFFENREWIIELESSNILSEGFFVTTGSTPAGKFFYTQEVMHFRGKIKGKPGSFAALSILPDQVVGVIADEGGNINIGAINTTAAKLAQEHIIYRERDLLVTPSFECGSSMETPASNNDNPLPLYNPGASTTGVVNAEPVDIYFEADYLTYVNNSSSVTNVVNYVTALFNVINGVFINDSVNTKLSAVKVWDVPDPYIGYTNQTTALQAFSSNMSRGFPGDLAHFITQRNLGGAAAYLDVLCRLMSTRTGVSGALSNSFNPFPVYSYSVWVISHELGHNLGSPHTQSCYWPGGAIDNCSIPEGGCPPGPAPVNGGTIMSYCQQTVYGINLANGFGPLPGALIREKLRTTTCTSPSLYFELTSQVTREENLDTENGCFDYKLYSVALKITTPPSQPVSVTLLPTTSSAGLEIGPNKDVEIISPLSFTIDSNNLFNTIVLKVYNDHIQESMERLDINFDINANGGNAVKMVTSIKYSLFIFSDDFKPDSSINQSLLYESFDSISTGTGGWTQTVLYGAASPNRWIIKNAGGADFPGNAAYVSNDANLPGYSNDSTVIRLESPTMNTTGFSNITMGFWMKCTGEHYYDTVLNSGYLTDFGRLVYSINDGATWALLKDGLFNFSIKYFYSITLPAAVNNSSQFKIGLEWQNNTSIINPPGFIADSIVIKGTSTATIQTAAHAANMEEAYLGPYQTVHFYNPVTKYIMATIENNSAFDLGCTKLELLRTGAGATQCWGTLAGDQVSDKVYRVTTSNTDPSAAYTVKLYYSSAEINGWLAATRNTAADIRMVKTYGDLTLSSPASTAIFSSVNAINNFGVTPHTLLSATFTGATAPATYAIMKPYGPPDCPANFFNYSTNIAGTTYQWQVNTGTGYINITDDAVYNNSTTSSLQIISPASALFGNKYRCEVTTAAVAVYSQEFILKSGTTWTGTVSDAWENALNWGCGSVPGENTDVIINSGTTFSPHLNANTNIRSLTISPGSNLVIKSGAVLTVNH
jgi:Metallo-peptidase family M12